MIAPPPWKRPKEPTAKDLTAKWWREQIADLERASKERGETLSRGESEVLASQARVFGALGVPTDVAAALMGLSEAHFQSEYAEAYGVGAAAIIAQVAANYLRIATTGSDKAAARACDSILKSRGGEPWRPPAQKIEVSREPPKARLIDSSRLTFEQRQQLRELLMAASQQDQPAALEHDGSAE